MFQNCGVVKTLGTGLQTPSRVVVKLMLKTVIRSRKLAIYLLFIELSQYLLFKKYLFVGLAAE
jgi:hypothetical protein